MKAQTSRIGNDIERPCGTFSMHLGTDSSTLPFQEWSDEEIRAENWKCVVTPFQKTNRSSPKSRDRSTSKASGATTVDFASSEALAHFEDEQMVHLPYSVVAYEWKPASQVFPEAKLEVYVDSNNYPDLITANKHLLHSEFMRCFISSMHTLTYLGNTTRFPVEYVSSKFTPTTTGEPWRPWHHIYSNSFAGTKHAHEPTVNEKGKYILRLFWMGTWRKIYVDDTLPTDLLHHILLPSLHTSGPLHHNETDVSTKNSRIKIRLPDDAKKENKVVELWPFLLAKALLKIASLTWYEDREVVDFDVLQCLTGWHPQRIATEGLPISDIWQICWANTNHFAWPSDGRSPPTTVENNTKLGKPVKGKKKEKQNEKSVDEEVGRCCVVAYCNNLRDLMDADEPLFPCWDHHFLIDQTRDIPLTKPTITADLELWKRLRWLSWAAKKGMIPDEELRAEIKCYKLVSPFKKISEHVVYKQPSKVTLHDAVTALAATQTEAAPKKSGTKGKDKGSAKGEKTPKGSKKSDDSKTKQDKKKQTGKVKQVAPDPSFWVDYNTLSYQINTLIVYYKPSEFHTKIEITQSDAKRQTERRDAEPEWQVLTRHSVLQNSRNEPIYVFTESIDTKLILIYLSQAGYTDILFPEVNVDRSTIIGEKFTECEFCLASLVKRVKGNITKEEVKDYVAVERIEPTLVTHYRPMAHVVMEEFDWKTDKLGATVTSMNTYGAKAIILSLGPGRRAFKLWIKSDNPCMVQIFSDTSLAIGGLETILIAMSHESELLEDACTQIASSFGDLVEGFATPGFPAKLRAFYNSYKPRELLTKAECAVIHDTFYSLLYELIEKNSNKEELNALNLLLLRWSFPNRETFPHNSSLCNCYDEDDLEFVKLTERYAAKIQAFFRGVYERRLMRRHCINHDNYKTTANTLRNICSSVFSPAKETNSCSGLIRTFLSHPDMKQVREKYDLYEELENVLVLKQSEGMTKLLENHWNFICRYQFFVHSSDPVPIRISLFCDSEEHVVRVIDNDTSKEIMRYTNNAVVSEYKANANGYTVLCYSWPSTSQNLSYKLMLAGKKEVDEKFTLSADAPDICPLNGMYIPNVHDTVCKYLINVHSEHAVISVHFAACFNDAILNLRLYNDRNKLLKQCTGKGHVILPAFCLPNRNKLTCDPITAKSSATNSKRKIRIPSKTTQKMQEKKSRQSVQLKKSRLKVIERQSTATIQGYDSHQQSATSTSAKANLHAFSPRSSNKDAKKNMKLDEPTVYCLEVSVADDSWPLNAEEWKNTTVRSLKGDPPPSQSSNILLVPSIGSLRKPAKQRSLMRASKLSLQKPFWTMEIVQNQNDWVEFIKDRRRQTEITEVKTAWCSVDTNRPKLAQKLRETFLEENEIPNSDLHTRNPDARGLDKAAFATKILPPLDLTPYMIKDPAGVKDRRIFKNIAALEMEEERESALRQEAEKEHQRRVEKMNAFVNQQIECLNIANEWFREVRRESSRMMQDAMRMREECLKAELQQKAAEDAATKKQTKKGKKDKKG